MQALVAGVRLILFVAWLVLAVTPEASGRECARATDHIEGFLKGFDTRRDALVALMKDAQIPRTVQPRVIRRNLTSRAGKPLHYPPEHPLAGQPVKSREYYFEYKDERGLQRQVIVQEHSHGHKFDDDVVPTTGRQNDAEIPHFNVRPVEFDLNGEPHAVRNKTVEGLREHYTWGADR